MWKNYWNIALRNLWKRKSYALLNIVGLAIGTACFILLSMFTKHETTFDQFHEHANQLYRVKVTYGENGGAEDHVYTPSALSETLKSASSQIVSAVRIAPWVRTLKIDGNLFSEKEFLYADNNFFSVFTFPLIAGDKDKVLTRPNSLVISESAAKKYFSTVNAVGKVLDIGGVPYQVSGVMKDVPSNSQLRFNMVASFMDLPDGKTPNWNRPNYNTYIEVQPGSNMRQVREKVNQNIIQVLFGGQTPPEGFTLKLDYEPLTSIHLHSPHDAMVANVDIRYIYAMNVVALLMILIACINFMNLATARSSERAKEIGVRKAIGARKWQVFLQFLVETACITMLGLLIGILIAFITLPYFNNLSGRVLSWKLFSVKEMILLGGSLWMGLTLLAGTYPAVFLSSFSPLKVLKGGRSFRGGGLRRILVVFQFAASVFFIIGTFVVFSQLNYIRNSKPGMNRSHVVVLDVNGHAGKNFDAFKQQLLQQPGVSAVSASYDSPVNTNGGYSVNEIEGKGQNLNLAVTAIPVERDFVKLLDIGLLSGNYFTDADVKDLSKEADARTHFMINETAAREWGLDPASAVGKRITMNGRVGTISAVVKDYHFASFKEKIQPLVIFLEYDYFGKMMVKTTGDTRKSIDQVQTVWQHFLPDVPFEYHFLDDEFNRMYKDDQRTAYILTVFATIVILVSCLGLLGLAAYTAEQRTKEISVRKVLGATVQQILFLLSKDFLKLVCIGILIAVPLAYYLAHNWLNSFAYHVGISAWIFILSGIIALLIALLTVGYQSLKAALVSPAESLKMNE